MPKILIVGAGAIGCTLAWHLSGTEAELALLARGERARALANFGLTLYRQGAMQDTHKLRVLDGDFSREAWDVVLVCVKHYDLADVLRHLQNSRAPAATIVPLVNGVPWWLLRANAKLDSCLLSQWGPAYEPFENISIDHVIGGVIHVPAQMRDATTVDQGSRDTLTLGELDGSDSRRLRELTSLINQSDLQCRISDRIQADVWHKLLGNAAFNPVSALADTTMAQMLERPALHDLCSRLIAELLTVGSALGYDIQTDVGRRLEQAASAGDARTSMLQDASAGKPIEGETLVGVVVRLARFLNVRTPALDNVWALLQIRFHPR